METDQIKSTLPMIRLDEIRHPKMATVKTPYLEKFMDELIVDEKLGLENQSKLNAEELFKRDVDELTSSNEYYQVSPELVGRMFQMGSLKLMCLGHNIREFAFKTIRELAFGMLLFLGSCAALWPAIKFFQHADVVSKTSDNSGWVALGLMCCVATVVGITFAFVHTFRRTRTVDRLVNRHGELQHELDNVTGLFFDYFFLTVKLQMEPIKETLVKIPFPVKCKILEAQEKSIFKSFVIGYPRFDVENKQSNIKFPEIRFNADPVVLGVSEDSRMFLIAWWDIKKDIDKVKNNIRFFKKFKVIL